MRLRSWFLLAIVATLPCMVMAQAEPVERTFAASKAEVAQGLSTLQQSTAGRLPTVEGFVVEQNQPPNLWQRPRYTCSVEVLPQGTGSRVRVRAHVTAWFAGTTAGQSGYRELPSNGRLETDLLDELEDWLGQKENASKAPRKAVPAPAVGSRPLQPTLPGSASAGPMFVTPRPGAVALPPRTATESVSSARPDSQTEQALRDQAKNLEEILQNQTHPEDLAAVRKSKTPVYSRPSEQGDVLFLADAQDEFQVLNTSSEWVHVQISGLSRGWIRGSDLELPSRQNSPAATAASKPAAVPVVPHAAPASGETQPFRLTRQEVNTYPGDWAPLRGKSVRILSLTPTGAAPTSPSQKWETAQLMFRRAAARIAAQPTASAPIEGVVLVFDSADGGMVSTTVTSLREWDSGHLPEEGFRAQCSFDPPEAFQSSQP